MRVKLDRSLHYCLVVPTSLKKAALEKAHAAHFGQKKTIISVEDHFYWPNYRADAVKFVQGCLLCQEFKAGNPLRQKFQALPPASKPLERVSVDLTDMLSGYQNYRYVLTVICHYARYVVFYPLRSKTSEAVAKLMRKYFLTIGTPVTLLSDLGQEFQGNDFKQVCSDFDVAVHHSLPYHPQGNSISERMHRTFKTTLAVMAERNPLSWPQYLDESAHALNTMVHATIGVQPYFAFHSRYAKRYAGIPLPTVDSIHGDDDISEAHSIIRETSARLAKKILEVANRSRKEDPSMLIGDLVWVFNECPIPGTARKLNRKWLGPYRIEQVIRKGAAYKMSNPFDPEQALVARSADKIKKYIPQMEFLEPEEVLDVQEVTSPDPTPEIPSSRYPQRDRRPRALFAP